MDRLSSTQSLILRTASGLPPNGDRRAQHLSEDRASTRPDPTQQNRTEQNRAGQMKNKQIRTEDKPHDEPTHVVDPICGWRECGTVEHDG